MVSAGRLWVNVLIWALFRLVVLGEETNSATSNNGAPTGAENRKANATASSADSTAEVVIDSDGTVTLIGDQQHTHPPLPDFPRSYLGPIVSTDHNFSAYQHKPRRIQYPEYIRGDNPYKATADVQRISDEVSRSRRYHVKNAMKHAWDGYKNYAWGFDELLPVSKKGRNNWGGMGTTLVDSLDTLWLMGLKNEFNEATAWVREHLNHTTVGSVSVFETTIRSLGGLLSAYDLSGDPIFLKQADDLGSRLMKSFDTMSGIPFGRVNLGTGQGANAGDMRDRASLSEFATLQVEFRYLAHVTGKFEYAEAVENIFHIVKTLQPNDGLIPIYAINTRAMPMVSDLRQIVSFGAHGDSAYEYMLKIWLQGGKKEMMYRRMYDKSMGGMHKHLLKLSTPSGLAYVTQRQDAKNSDHPIYVHTMEHLTCYLPGVLALGAYTDPFGLDSDRAKRDLKTARALAYTCYEMYQQMETGLAAEYVNFNEDGQDLKAQNNSAYYLLRPEAVESFYVLNKLTGDPVYREWGWKIFQSIERYCKLPVAYGKVADVNNPKEEPKDLLESFMMSETLKYLYLLFDPDNEDIDLETHVFNTEAHPLRLLGDPSIKKSEDDGGPKDFPHLGVYPKPTDFTKFLPPGAGRYDEYKEGLSPYNISPEIKRRSDELARQRRTYIVGAMKHAWEGYREYAFGHDEVLPKSKKGNDPWGGMGTTLVDSLDTLWLMGLKEAFYEGRDWVRDHLEHDNVATVSVFETTIRSLGGLLSAYDLSRDFAFLEKADDLGSRLLKAFDSPSGIPYGQVHLQTGEASNIQWVASSALLAEYATLQVEFRYLAKVTGTKEYALKSEKIFEIVEQLQPESGLLSLQTFNLIEKPRFASTHISFGAMGDSAYEYMLKQWLQGGKKEHRYRIMYDKAIQGLHDELLVKSTPSNLLYVAEKVKANLVHKMDHLVCFLPGVLALGAFTDPYGIDSARAQRDLKTARGLAYTCYQMYASTKTGLAPEIIKFRANQDHYIERRDAFYILRPEAVESFFVLNRLTGDPIYREWGWEVFLAIEKFCRLPVAYGSFKNVNDVNTEPEDRMESFFLAETLKYLFLLNDPDTKVDIINKHVLNTEAHPLRILDDVEPHVDGAVDYEKQHQQQQHNELNVRLFGHEGTAEDLAEALKVAERTIAAQAAQLEKWRERMEASVAQTDELLNKQQKEIERLRSELRRRDLN